VVPTTLAAISVSEFRISQDLPPGLSFNYTDGSISGTPAGAPMADEFTVTAINAYGQTGATFVLIVGPRTPAGTTAATISADSVVLAWRSVEHAETYLVFRADSAGRVFSMIAETSDTSHTDTSGLSAGTSWLYFIVAAAGQAVLSRASDTWS